MIGQQSRFLRRRRKGAQDVTSFRSYISAPALTTIKLPANGRLMFINRSVGTVGALAGSAGGRTFHTQTTRKTDFVNVERSVTVTVAAGFDLYIDTGLAQLKKIAGGV